jgi:hypothetical protein
MDSTHTKIHISLKIYCPLPLLYLYLTFKRFFDSILFAILLSVMILNLIVLKDCISTEYFHYYCHTYFLLRSFFFFTLIEFNLKYIR